jgi:four helix bundle protein
VAVELEDLRVLRAAETVADGVWALVVRWRPFDREVAGQQLARAADSIGANIAEPYGRYHYGEKLQFLYYARGILFETKYWLNRAEARTLMPADVVADFATQLTDLARQLKVFAAQLKSQRQGAQCAGHSVSDACEQYLAESPSSALFSQQDLQWLESMTST